MAEKEELSEEDLEALAEFAENQTINFVRILLREAARYKIKVIHTPTSWDIELVPKETVLHIMGDGSETLCGLEYYPWSNFEVVFQDDEEVHKINCISCKACWKLRKNE